VLDARLRGHDSLREANMKAYRSIVTVLGFLAVAAPGSALAQSDYPNKPVRIVVDSAAGSANDAALRILGDKLSRIWN